VRSIPRLATGIFIALLTLVVMTGPASAHTGFESSDPADGTTSDTPVDTITLVFSGEAEPTGDGFQVLDPTGELRGPTEATTADGLTWVLRFDPPIAGGQAGVRWMVKAPDAHPIDGSFAFMVSDPSPAGAQSGQESGSGKAPLQTGPSTAVDLDTFLDTGSDATSTPLRVGAAGRMITLAGTLVGIGALIFAAVVLRGARRDVRHVVHWVRRAGLLVMVGVAVELVAQLAVDGGGRWSAVWSLSTMRSVLFSAFGIAVVLRIVGGMAMASGARIDITPASETPDPVVAIRELIGVGVSPTGGFPDDSDARQSGLPSGSDSFTHHNDHAWFPTIESAGAMLGGIAVLAAYLFDGHTVTKGDRLLTGIVDIVHVAGGAVWAGGVLMLASVLWRRHRQGRELRALQLAVRFSVVATIALVAVGVAGLALTVIILDSPSEIWSTEWGRLLLLKTLFVAVAAGAGGYNHKVLIPQMNRAPDDPALTSRFRTIVTGEAGALVAVLVVTAFLMGAAS
jgi:copper transport protein